MTLGGRGDGLLTHSSYTTSRDTTSVAVDLVELCRLAGPADGNARRHHLLDILTIALTATICGAESCVDFADFARDREALFREFLELPGGLPSQFSRLFRLFRLFDPVAFATCFSRFLDGLGEAGPGVIAIDGKTLRRSFDRAAGRSALHVVTFASEARPVVGQLGAGDKESEITAARSLLGLIDLKGALVTGDGLHCQGETARLIIERGGDWLSSMPRLPPGSPTR